MNTNAAIADLSYDLIRDGFHYVLTGRLQTDPVERRFSQYRQMSGGRFLVSLTEVLRSEKIITYQILLKRDVDIGGLTMSSTDEIHKLTSDFLTTLPTDCIDLLIYQITLKILLHMWQGTFLIRLYNVPSVMLVLNYFRKIR